MSVEKLTFTAEIKNHEEGYWVAAQYMGWGVQTWGDTPREALQKAVDAFSDKLDSRAQQILSGGR